MRFLLMAVLGCVNPPGLAVEPSHAPGEASSEAAVQPSSGKPVAAPFRIAGHDKPMESRDEFLFWGWSPDGRYFAFELRDDAGTGAVTCDMHHQLFVVDASTDSFAPDGVVSGRYPELDPDGECGRPSPAEQIDTARTRLFERYGIVGTAQAGEALPPAKDRAQSSRPVRLPDGSTRALSMTLTHTDVFDGGWLKGAGYRAVLGDQVLESGVRSRAYAQSYDASMVFWSPSKKTGALLVQKFEIGYERGHATWMMNGFVLHP